MKHARIWVAERLWSVADWLYPYVDSHTDGDEVGYWDLSATYRGTRDEAEDWFDKLCGLSCDRDHPLHNCGFVVGGLRPIEDEEGEGDNNFPPIATTSGFARVTFTSQAGL